MRTAVVAIALAFAMSALSAFAQDDGGPPPAKGGPGGGNAKGGGPGGSGRGQGGFHLLPPRAMEQLNLTEDQKKQVSDLEAEVKAKLAQILTPEQMQKLSQMRPPRPQDGKGGPGGGGPGGGGPPGGGTGGAEGKAPQRPPSE